MQSKRISSNEYLALEKQFNCRDEFVDGSTFPKPRSSARHDIIVSRIVEAFKNSFPESDFFIIAGEQIVAVPKANCFYYPDVVVLPRDSHDPVLIAEVMGNATALIDQREKSISYKMLPSLKSYFIFSENRSLAEHYQRKEEGHWRYSSYVSGTISIDPSKQPGINLDEIYVELEEIADEQNFTVPGESYEDEDDIEY